MGVCVGAENPASKTKLNWTGTIIGAYHKDKMITGDSLAEGQAIIALKENGFRCNGISAVRKALREKFGDAWWSNPEAQESVKAAATPSVLYDLFVNTLHGWYTADFKPEIKIHAIVHLSGGALKEKLTKDLLFPRGLSADLDNLWEPPQIMRQCAEWHGIGDEEFYEVWNGGQGMLLVVDKKDSDYCLKRAADFSVQAKIAGQITKESKSQVSIISQLTKGKKIIY
jgi:phosphoribosylformylglycinamidine cyclo-ligase